MSVPLMPNAKSFSELFAEFRQWTPTAPPLREHNQHPKNSLLLHVGHYCSRSAQGGDYRPSLYVVSSPELLELLGASMIVVDYDSIYFQIIDFPDGTSRIWAKYNQIIGSRFICELPTEALPVVEREEE